jgi:hypothetical protein
MALHRQRATDMAVTKWLRIGGRGFSFKKQLYFCHCNRPERSNIRLIELSRQVAELMGKNKIPHVTFGKIRVSHSGLPRCVAFGCTGPGRRDGLEAIDGQL